MAADEPNPKISRKSNPYAITDDKPEDPLQDVPLVDVPLAEPVKKKKKAAPKPVVAEPPKPQEPAGGWGLGGLWNAAPSVTSIAETLKKNVQE